MIKIKNWSTAIADEVWKVHICSRDIQRAEEIASYLTYVMSKPSLSFEENLEEIEKFTSRQIVEALKNQKIKSLETIKNGLGKYADK